MFQTKSSKNLNEENIYECKLRGTLKVKNDKMNCIIGDIVEFDEKEKVIEKIEKRKNFLYRPLIANIDFIGILFAIKSPNFDFTNFRYHCYIDLLGLSRTYRIWS